MTKSFARVQRSHSRNVAAYRAELPALLGISRKKVVTFPSHLLSARSKVVLNPFTLTQRANHEEPVSQYSASPILVSALPLVSQQTNVLAALMNNLLLHHAGIDLETMYAYGEVELVTFLSAVTLSHLLASADQRLSFMSHAHRRYSALFFKLFNVELLRVDGFSRHCFAPPISMPKPMPHEKKLKEFNLINGLFYAVGIRPKRYVTLDSVEVGAPNPEGAELDSRCLLTYAYWMNLIGKQQASKKTAKVLEELCPESCSSAFLVVDKDCRIGELSTTALEKAFLAVREELQHLKKFENYKENITSKRSS
nr:Protein C50E3.5 [Haemonchus contortus]